MLLYKATYFSFHYYYVLHMSTKRTYICMYVQLYTDINITAYNKTTKLLRKLLNDYPSCKLCTYDALNTSSF